MSKKPDELFEIAAPSGDSGIGVDRAARVIQGARVMQLGQLNDERPLEVDEDTLEQAVELINQPNKGLKARFTHSAAKGHDGLATHLGRWVNARIDGDAVRADLQLSEAASKGPSGDLPEYLLSLAEEDPESFGVSLAGVLDTTVFEKEADIYPIRFERLWSADVVGDPAATRGGLFSVVHDEEEIPVQENTQVAADLDNEQHDVAEVTLESIREEAQPFVEAFGSEGAAWFLQGKSLLECYQAQCQALAEEVKFLTENIIVLENKLIDLGDQDGEAEPLSTSDVEVVDEARAKIVAERERLRREGVSDPVAKWAASYSN